ncbi:MAG: glycoside hydrolase family 3 N-terminal domain-containing protein [Pseudomonadota bacterium]
MTLPHPLALITAPHGHRLSDHEAGLYRSLPPFGFILFARNIQTPWQVKALCSDLRGATGNANTPIFIDQEGGTVQRLRPPHWPEYQSADFFDKAYRHDPQQAMKMVVQQTRKIARDLAHLGITANCAPVCDLHTPQTHPFLARRCYGKTAEQVIDLAGSVADQLMNQGIIPVIKHIPGHGRGTVDSHKALPVTDASCAWLMQHDFRIFKALAHIPFAMTAHMVYRCIDPIRPATCSPDCIGFIRNELGFRGVLLSDDLSMQALTGSLTQRFTRALAAGCDLGLYCAGDLDDSKALLQIAPRLSPSAMAAWQRTA